MSDHMEENEDLSRLYAATPRDEPPAALDSAVWARARLEMEPPAASAAGPTPWLRRLTFGPEFALAAVVVLSVSLVLSVQHEQSPPVGGQAPQTFEEASSAPAAPSEAQGQTPLTGKASEPAPAVLVQPRAENAHANSHAPLNAESFPAQAASPGGAAAIPGSISQNAGVPAAEAERRDAAAGTSVAPPARAAIAPQAPLVAPAVPPAYAPAPPAAPSLMRPPAESSSRTTTIGIRGTNFGVQDKEVEQKPEAWLKQLAELKAQGRVQEFRAGLAEFKKRYPSYVVPEALAVPE
ncbi:MAG TPA: hypothetical protein VN667_06825 [Burkholderiales bacterium]|nr:hypothetical protein [Burkholderiales bacterium]